MNPDEQKEYQRQHYLKNREKKLAYSKAKYAENPQKVIARAALYQSSHPEVARRKWKKYEASHPEKMKEKQKKRYANNKEYFYDWHLKSKYGITILEYKELRDSQNGKCLICRKKKILVVDHDHTTGKVRGLLCHACNTSLGFMEENISSFENAIEYLKEHRP